MAAARLPLLVLAGLCGLPRGEAPAEAGPTLIFRDGGQTEEAALFAGAYPCQSMVDVKNQQGRQKQIPLYAIALSHAVDRLRLLEQEIVYDKSSRRPVLYSQALHDDEERHANTCPAAVGLAYLWNAEVILVTLLPLASSETPESIVREPLNEVNAMLEHAGKLLLRQQELFSQDDGQLILQKYFRRVLELVDLVWGAMQEPWFGGRREWVRSSWAWYVFNGYGRVTGVSIPPTTWHFEAAFGAQRKTLRNALDAATREGWRELASVITAVGGPELEWWPGGGTLIGFMRYGKLHGFLSDEKVDMVDDDIDVYVVLPTAGAWLKFCSDVTAALIKLGWFGCYHMLQLRYNNATQRLAEVGAELRGRAVLFCAKLGDGSDIMLNIMWTIPVEVVEPPVGEPEAPCPAWMRLGRRAPGCTSAVRLAKDARTASITDEVFCLPGGACHSASKSFRSWPGAALPAGLRRPLVTCQAFGFPAPCPSGAQELLLHQGGRSRGSGEYWRARDRPHGAAWPCLALPDIACPDASEATKASWSQKRQVDDPRNLRLRREGLNLEDRKLIRAHNRRLRRGGFLAHNLTGCDWARCSRT